MKPTILLAAAVTLVSGAEAPKDDAAAREVEQSLRALNAAYAKQDVATLRRLFATDHMSITQCSGIMDRETHLKNLAAWTIAEYQEADLKVTMLTKDTARVTYQLTAKRTYKGKKLPAKSYAVSIWINRDGSWQEASYQETPIVGSSGLRADEPSPDDAATREVVRLANTLSQAFVKGDAETITRLLADDQIAILGYGRPETKADQLKKLADFRFEKASLEDVTPIPLSNDLVAVSFTLVRKGTFQGRALTPKVHALAVWARRDSQWRQVTYQETLPDKQ
jgi:hypothetical protein